MKPLDAADEVADDDIREKGCESEHGQSQESGEFSHHDSPAREFGEEENFVITLFDFLRHEDESSERHEYAADTHRNPPKWTDGFRVPHEDSTRGLSAWSHAELELCKDRCGCEEMDAEEWIDETGATKALAQLLHGHGTEVLWEICFRESCHGFRLGQNISVDSRVASGDFDGAAVFCVKIARANTADDAVSVAKIAEGFEGFEEKSFAEA